MDRKGETVAVAKIGSKIITRKNFAATNPLNVKFFGINFDSWHAEIRTLKTILKNPYLLKLAQTYGIYLHIIRFTNARNLTNSKPCEKCQKCLTIFSKRYNVDVDISYFENGKIRKEHLG